MDQSENLINLLYHLNFEKKNLSYDLEAIKFEFF